MSVRKVRLEVSGPDRTLAEEPAASIAHGGVCEGGGLRRPPVDPPLLGRRPSRLWRVILAGQLFNWRIADRFANNGATSPNVFEQRQFIVRPS
jgi:hypothetical protein